MEGEESKPGRENLFEEIITENFPRVVKEKGTHFKKHRVSNLNEPKETHTKIHHN